MNIKHIEVAQRIKTRIDKNTEQAKNISNWLRLYPHGNSDGKSVSAEGKLYALHIHEYADGSGEDIDLTGSMIQTEVLQYAKELLQKQIEKDLAFIESL